MQTKKPVVLLALLVVLAVLSITACDPNTNNDQIPVASDFTIGNLNQTEGSVTDVTISPNDGKSTGTITIYYEGTDGTTYAKSSTLPTAAGTYTVTFDVAAATGWEAVSGLSAGTLSITVAGTVATPTATPVGSTYREVNATLVTSTTGASIHYTTNGDTPNASSTLYTSAITISTTTTLKAIAVKEGMINSSIMTVTYTIDPSAPDPFTTIPAITTYLEGKTPNTTTNPIFLPVAIDMGDMNNDSNWRQLLIALGTVGKYVNLDLSGCTVNNNQFGNSGYFYSYQTNHTAGLNKIVSIILPTSTTSVNMYNISAFSGCMSLTSITMPASTAINTNVFAGCTNLISFTLTGTGSLSTLENGKILVRNNTELVAYPSASGSITVPAGITSIGLTAFKDCTDLTSITLPTSLTSIRGSAFNGCTSLSFIVSGTGAFSTLENGKILVKNNTELAAYPSASGIVTVSAGITSIGDGAFNGCTSLTSINLPTGLVSMKDSTFDGCTGLASVTLPVGLVSIGQGAFRDCTSLTSITLPDSLTSIGYSAFNGCTSLTSIALPAGITSISGFTFSFCTNLSSITLPASITSIAEYVFQSCTSLTSVTLPASLTSIGMDAFSNCMSLELVTINAITPPTLAADTFIYTPASLTIKVPSASVAAYKMAPSWSEYADKIVAQ